MSPKKPWIRVIEDGEPAAPPLLQELYDRYRDPRGHVDNILQIHSLNPESLRAHFNLYKLVMHGRTSELTRVQREMIALAVSAANGCHY